MCEFCHKHGDGNKWYLQAQNYSEDLLSDLNRRKFIKDFLLHPESLTEGEANLVKLKQLPSFVREAIMPFLVGRQKKAHYGQVVPIEDVERIFDFVSPLSDCLVSVVRLW